MVSSLFNLHGVQMPPGSGDNQCMCLDLKGDSGCASEDLASEIGRAAEFHHDSPQTTVWIDVVAGDVPTVLLDALAKLEGYGVGVVVTREEVTACSHGPGKLLSDSVCQAIYKVNRRGLVLHPYARKLVPSKPEN